MIAAMRMADSGVLLQQSNSVESISHVDTVCMDKTGTITTNKLRYEDSIDLIPSDEASLLISSFASATGSRNRTIDALLEHYGSADVELVDEIQFSSQRKYSAVRVIIDGEELTMYMGAWTSLCDYVESDRDIPAIIDAEARKGLRTVLICRSGDHPLFDQSGEPVLAPMTPISVVSIRDEVRPDCRETIQVFLDNGMDLKVISGDDPVTVDSLFTIAGIPGERRIVSGPELEAMSKEEFEKAALECNIFGRMKPENKERVIEALRDNGRYVAMIGDGVNDVKSLKTAHVGVSLESGSGAARGVADMILVKDNFSALPKALVEGRKTVSGMRDILKLYLTRNFTLAVIFVFIYVLFGNIPMIPIQNTFYAFISVSIMAFFAVLHPVVDNDGHHGPRDLRPHLVGLRLRDADARPGCDGRQDRIHRQRHHGRSSVLERLRDTGGRREDRHGPVPVHRRPVPDIPDLPPLEVHVRGRPHQQEPGPNRDNPAHPRPSARDVPLLPVHRCRARRTGAAAD